MRQKKYSRFNVTSKYFLKEDENKWAKIKVQRK